MNIAQMSVSSPLSSWQFPQIAWPSFLSSADLALDLGTANSLVYRKHHGIILSEPSVVALDRRTGKPLAVGLRAKEMEGKTSEATRCVRPLKDGVIADFDATIAMVSYFLRCARAKFALLRPRVVIGVPSEITQVERRAVLDAAEQAGVREVHLVDESMAAALGCDLPVEQVGGNMIVDIGGGTAEIAIISMGGNIYARSLRVGGDEMDLAIQRHLRRHLGLSISLTEAERLKISLGSALPMKQDRWGQATGRGVSCGMPRSVRVEHRTIVEALHEPVRAICAGIQDALEQTSPEVARDVIARGITLAGGGALLRGLATRLRYETKLDVRRAADPLTCVARGAGKIIDNFKGYRELCLAGR